MLIRKMGGCRILRSRVPACLADGQGNEAELSAEEKKKLKHKKKREANYPCVLHVTDVESISGFVEAQKEAQKVSDKPRLGRVAIADVLWDLCWVQHAPGHLARSTGQKPKKVDDDPDGEKLLFWAKQKPGRSCCSHMHGACEDLAMICEAAGCNGAGQQDCLEPTLTLCTAVPLSRAEVPGSHSCAAQLLGCCHARRHPRRRHAMAWRSLLCMLHLNRL